MKNLLTYLVVIPAEASVAVIAAALLAVIITTVLLTLACWPARAAEPAQAPLRDPTRPLASTAPRIATAPSAPVARPAAPVVLPELQLVLTATDRRYAVIDGELLSVGDSLRGMALLDIRDEAVILKTPNGPRTLPLSTGSDTQGK